MDYKVNTSPLRVEEEVLVQFMITFKFLFLGKEKTC